MHELLEDLEGKIVKIFLISGINFLAEIIKIEKGILYMESRDTQYRIRLEDVSAVMQKTDMDYGEPPPPQYKQPQRRPYNNNRRY